MKKAVFPGSFDPVTLGHVDIVNRALPMFDEIIVAVGVNAEKNYMWKLVDRLAILEKVFEGESRVRIAHYSGLTAAFCKKEGARFILRGLRNTADFSYEQTIAQANEKVNGVDSVFLMGAPELAYISSSVVRDIARHGGDYSSMVPFSPKP